MFGRRNEECYVPRCMFISKSRGWKRKQIKGHSSLLLIVFIVSNEHFSALRRHEHRNLSLKNFELLYMSKIYFKNLRKICTKLFTGILFDFKYVVKNIKHIFCHIRQKHDPCLLEVLVS